MTAGVFGHVFQVLRPRQLFQHFDGRHDVVIDDGTLFRGQRSGANQQVFQFVIVEHIARFPDAAHALQIRFFHGFGSAIDHAQKILIVIQRRLFAQAFGF